MDLRHCWSIPKQFFFFHFPWSIKVVMLNVIVVLQISTSIHILDRKHHISTYHISIVLFSSTIWRFHQRIFLNLNFFGDFIPKNSIYFLQAWWRPKFLGAIWWQIGKKQNWLQSLSRIYDIQRYLPDSVPRIYDSPYMVSFRYCLWYNYMVSEVCRKLEPRGACSFGL